MKSLSLLFATLLINTLLLTGCAEEKKKAEERGKVPLQTLNNAQKKVDDAAAKMQSRMQGIESHSESDEEEEE